jgi:hypothetical protein
MVIWSNSHGSYVIGIATLGLWLAGSLWHALINATSFDKEGLRQRLVFSIAALASAILASFLNPRGVGIMRYVSSLTTDPIVQNLVTEWAPPTFDELHGALFLAGLLVAATVLALSPKRPSPFQLFRFLAFAALGLKTKRGAIWFGLALAPVLADHLKALRRSLVRRGLIAFSASSGSYAFNAVLTLMLVLSATATLPWFKEALPLPPEKASLVAQETPVEATAYLLEAQPPGHLFHAAPFGSYLIWAAQPDYPVFIDPRIELYPPRIWSDYLTISAAGHRWQELLMSYHVNTLMLSPVEQPRLVKAARAAANWTSVYEDDTAVVYVRARLP